MLPGRAWQVGTDGIELPGGVSSGCAAAVRLLWRLHSHTCRFLHWLLAPERSDWLRGHCWLPALVLEQLSGLAGPADAWHATVAEAALG
jgi:hypothetical protein